MDQERRYENQVEPALMDNDHYAMLRSNVHAFWMRVARDHYREGMIVLDVAPERQGGIGPMLPKGAALETLDIDPGSGASYATDLCAPDADLPVDRFDCIVCTEVLEHTLDPFAAVRTLRRMLKGDGRIFISTPFNFRIHGPLPDCWRFTEHGLRALMKDFVIEELVPLETPGRPLMPIQYTLIGRKPVPSSVASM